MNRAVATAGGGAEEFVSAASRRLLERVEWRSPRRGVVHKPACTHRVRAWLPPSGCGHPGETRSTGAGWPPWCASPSRAT